MSPDPKILLILVRMRMPFGKYKDRLLCDLPVSYLEWFANKGFPEGQLGMYLETLHVIKTNGLDKLLEPLKVEARKERWDQERDRGMDELR
jgi:uncharacterized protein